MHLLSRGCMVGLLGVSLLAGGCVGGKSNSGQKRTESLEFPVSCVAVLPVVQGARLGGPLTEKEEKAMEQGVQVLDRSLREYFGARGDVRLLTDGLGKDKRESPPLERAQAAAGQLSCNAVLETTLHGYKQRVGGKYTAKEPAAASFTYRLLAMPDGAVLCQGHFNEQQQSLMENIFKLKHGAENAFTWVTAERLVQQALQERLDTCAYLVED